ncbi:Hypothetical protein A7982_03009 [Minicystis rosea]|nr:Hypothetical protein A7982_03009 [Minicystis rosea]
MRVLAALFCAVAAIGAPSLARAAGLVDFQPIFVGEIDYRLHSIPDIEGESGFAANRLRLGARMGVSTWFSAAAQIELVNREHPVILDAMVAVRPTPAWEISFGASKTPLFSSARDEAIWALPVPELSMVARAFWPQYDVGLEVHRLPTPRLPIEGWLRIGNGSGSALGNDNRDYALDARLDVALGRARVGVPATVPFGLRFGSGFHAELAEDRLGVGGTTPAGFAFYRPATVSGPRYLAESHLVAYAGPIKLTIEAALAKEGRTADTDGNPATPRAPQAPVLSKGGVVELGWMIFGPHRRHGAWPVDAAIGTWDWGGLELGVRAERLVLGRGARDVQPGGATAGSAAIRWWTTSFLAASLAGYYTHYDAAPIEEPDRRSSWLGLFRVTVRAPSDLVSQLGR